jgi:hypothetical protein
LELDYLIYSSGLALCRWTPQGPGEHLFVKAFTPAEQVLGLSASLALEWGFLAFKAPPDSHAFYYLDPPRGPRSAGFQARLEQFKSVASPWPGFNPPEPLSQFLIMAPAEEFPALRTRFADLAPGLSITQSSSPYEDDCVWLEVFPGGVSKGSASQALVELLGWGPESAAAVGNDFNDEDLLAWAGRSFAVPGAPAELLARFEPLPGPGCVLARLWRALGH